jgi:hypothetical protein
MDFKSIHELLMSLISIAHAGTCVIWNLDYLQDMWVSFGTDLLVPKSFKIKSKHHHYFERQQRTELAHLKISLASHEPKGQRVYIDVANSHIISYTTI